MVQMIQLTRGQEETLHRITTALEKIAENGAQPKDTISTDNKKYFIVVRVDASWKFVDIDGIATDIESAEQLVKTEQSKSYAKFYEWTIAEYDCSDIIK